MSEDTQALLSGSELIKSIHHFRHRHGTGEEHRHSLHYMNGSGRSVGKFSYPANYCVVPTLANIIASLAEEIKILQRISGLENGSVDWTFFNRVYSGEIVLPVGAERWMLIPRWNLIGITYNEAVNKLFLPTSVVRGGRFCNQSEELITAEGFQESLRTTEMFGTLIAEQNNAAFILTPVQFGVRYRNISALHTRESFSKNEFGLGVFAGLIMLITHPERMTHRNHLRIDCVGSECVLDVGIGHDSVPTLGVSDRRLNLKCILSTNASVRYGSITAFVL